MDIVFAVCYFSGRNAREGRPIRDLTIVSIHGREKVRTPFAIMKVGKQTHCNRCCEVLLTDDPQSLAPQSPAGTGAGLGNEIRNWAGRLNCTPYNNTY